MNTIYLFLNKGGTGRTSSVFNLSWVLSDMFNKRVLVVDMDAESNISELFNVSPENGDDYCSIAHCLIKQLNINGKRRPFRDCIRRVEGSTIDVAVSSFELSQANVYILNEISRIQLLKNALKEVENDYDYVFIDTGSANDQLFLNSIYAADLIIPTIKTNFLEIKNLSMLETTLDELEVEGISPNLCGVLCTISDNTSHDKQCVKLLLEGGYEVLGVIKKQVAIPDSNAAGLPVYKYDKSKQAAKEYVSVGIKLLEYFNDESLKEIKKKMKRG